MADIDSKYCDNHEYRYSFPMQRLYKRMKGIFKSIGWICSECDKIVLDEVTKEIKKKTKKKVMKK